MDLVVTHGLNLVYAIATLGLIALGLALVFGLLGVMNMAHGEFVALGAYCVLLVQQAGLPMLAAAPLAIILCGGLGWIMEWSIIRHLYKRPFDTLLATWGLAILMRKGFELVFGRGYQSVDQVAPGTVNVLGADYPVYRLILLGAILLVLGGLALWYRGSKTGARIAAMVENPELAQAVGINTQMLARMTFVAGVSLAGLAGVMLAPLIRVEPYMGLDYLLSSFFTLVVGGLGSFAGLLTGSAVIGGTDALISALFDKTAGYMAVLTISILFLWLRPNGLISRH